MCLMYYATEAEASAALASVLALLGKWFRSFAEVEGQYLSRQLHRDGHKQPRIDYVLMPRDALLREGWSLGSIGVEVKKSDVKPGPVMNQMLDYRSAAFHTPYGHLVLDYIFLFKTPSSDQATYQSLEFGAAGSFMLQNRMGFLHLPHRVGQGLLRLHTGVTPVAAFGEEWVQIKQPVLNGKKIGSR